MSASTLEMLLSRNLPAPVAGARRLAWVVACAWALPLNAFAVTHVACIGSSNELAAALASLSSAADNDDADELRIRTGTYFAPAGGWVGAVTTHHDLAIHGGYTDAGCTQQTLDASQTVLDGNHASGVMTINTPLLPVSNIEVSGLTFQNGAGGDAQESNAGGLKIGDPNPINDGKIVVERNIFRNNSSASNGFSLAVGGLLAATDGLPLIVRGNLFIGNTAPNDAALHVESNNEIDIGNNTFSGNRSTDAARPVRTTFGYFSFAGVHLDNNVFWNNTAGAGDFDLDLSAHLTGAKGATLTNNDVQAATGTAVAESGTLHVDPAFAGDGNFRLSASSPLVDAGIGNPAGGLTQVDLDGAPRVAGAAVDRGAYERNAFTNPPAVAIGGGISGNWYDPTANQGGHGFQIEVLPNNAMLAIWFVFNPAGTAQNWIFALGNYDPGSNTATLPAVLEQGGAFPPKFDSRHLTQPAWGTLQFTFTDCDNGSASWTANDTSRAAGYDDVTFPIRRLTGIAGTTCP